MLIDQLEEIYVSMSRNKLRIALTGFSIAWGIFMLIVLLGAGNGLLHGVMDMFGDQAQNKVTLYPGRTSMTHEGLPKWREIYMDLDDVEYLRQQFPREIESIQPMFATSVRVSKGQNYVSNECQGIYPSYIKTGPFSMVAGRSVNDMDIRERRKVCMMTLKTSEQLFGDSAYHLGEWVKLYEIPFQIVGIYKTKDEHRDDPLWAPITTIGTIYKPNWHYSQLRLLVQHLETEEANKAFNDSVRAVMARERRFDPKDRNAMWIWNSYSDYLQTKRIFTGLQLFIWLIGLATLIAGVTGISNIMLITVKERTREFGIRKALGARPREIVALVLMESVAITLVFGYIGMLFGIGLTQLLDMALSAGVQGDGPQMFKDPTVDLTIVLLATIVMVIAGVIAGYIPAKRAVSIKPVEALAAS